MPGNISCTSAVLPQGEVAVMNAVKTFIYDPFLKEVEHLKETRSIETTNKVPLPTETNYTASSPR